MPKKWVEKKLEKNFKKCWKLVFLLNFYVFWWFSTFFEKNFQYFFKPFFGIFELAWQCSQFWLRWNNFIFSKWLSYSLFKKSILASSPIETHYSSYKLGKMNFLNWLQLSHFEKIELFHLNQNWEYCQASSKMPKNGLEKNWNFFQKMLKIIKKT